MSECVGVDVFSNDRTITLDDVAHLSLFEGKYGSIIRELLCRNVFGEHFDRLWVQMNSSLLPSFRFRYVDHVVVSFDVAWRDCEQLIDSHASSPQYAQHEVIPLATLVRCFEYLIDLLLFEVVGDILH